MELFPPTLAVYGTLGPTPSGRAWLERMPSLVDEAAEQWSLTLGPPYAGGSCSWVAPVTRADGSPAVLKLSWPHREASGEATALRAWGGRGAVNVLEHDESRYALLLERCEPGTELGAADHRSADDRLLVGCEIMRRLWSVPAMDGDLATLASVMGGWADELDERRARLGANYDGGLLALGSRLFRALPASATHDVVLHGDFNPGNVLAAVREPWLAIDPKPMVGDPAYDPWPLIEQIGNPWADRDPVRVLTERIALVADALDVEAERILAWSVARRCEATMASAAHGDPAGATRAMAEVRVLAAALGA